MLTPQLYLNVLCCRLLWALPQPYFQTLCYCASVSIASQRSQPISKLHHTHSLTPWITWQQFSSKQALSASFPFVILPSCIHPFSLTFIYPCAFRQPWRWWLLLQLLPTFPVSGSCHHWWLGKQLLRENSTQQQPPHICQGLSKSQHFTQHHYLLNWFNAIGGRLNSSGIPGAWAHYSPVWFRKALLNDNLPGHRKDLAANSPTRAKSTFSTKDAACEMQ